jgi:hypothetical protein
MKTCFYIYFQELVVALKSAFAESPSSEATAQLERVWRSHQPTLEDIASVLSDTGKGEIMR